MASATGAQLPGPSLLQLSNELIELVIERTFHEDLVHLAITSRFIYSLARTALQRHRQLVQDIRVVSNHHAPRRLSKLFRSILEEPESALYVQELQIRSWILVIQDIMILGGELMRRR